MCDGLVGSGGGGIPSAFEVFARVEIIHVIIGNVQYKIRPIVLKVIIIG